ncbi:MAG: hypothetical protein AAFZ07_29810, partial [Actinomycetota bacterium]
VGALAAIVIAVAVPQLVGADDDPGAEVGLPATTTAPATTGLPATTVPATTVTTAVPATTATPTTVEAAPTTAASGAPAPDPWAAGTAAGLPCNRLELPGFETAELGDTFYSGDPSNTTSLVPGAGVDGSAALRVGSSGAFGLYAEIVPLGESREHVFSAWIRRQGDPAPTSSPTTGSCIAASRPKVIC